MESKKLRILVFSWRDPKHPLAGGAEQVMHQHMIGWLKHGYKVTLFSSRFNKSPAKETLEGVEIIRQGHQYLGVQLAAFKYYLTNKHNYDFVVDQFHGIPFFTPLYVRKPILAVIQEVAKNVWLLNPLPWPLNLIVGRIGYFGEPLIFKLFYQNTQFMTGSASTKSDLTKLGIRPGNITIVNHGVIVEQTKICKKESIPTVIYLGRLSKDKGIEDALIVFNLIHKKLKKVQFWVVGSAETKEYDKHIRNLADRIAVKVSFFGFVSQEKKFELLAKSHVMLNPSHREGWGLVNIEANAMKTPVVGYDVVGVQDSILHNKTGLLAQLGDHRTMARYVIKLLGDKPLYNQLSKNAYAWSNSFTWGKSKQLSLAIIQKVYEKSNFTNRGKL